MTININLDESVSRRIYVTGNTYPIKDRLKEIGAKWDGDRKQWWVGTQKRSEVQAIVSNLSGTEVKENLSEKQVYGKVTYVSKSGKVGTYYVIGQSYKQDTGITRLRLTILDGSIDFWVDEAAVKWVKRYEPRTYGHGKYAQTSYQTLGSIQSFIKGMKDREEQGLQPVADYPGKECPCCGSEPLDNALHCWECGYVGQA